MVGGEALSRIRLFILTPFLALASMLVLLGGIVYVACIWFLKEDE